MRAKRIPFLAVIAGAAAVGLAAPASAELADGTYQMTYFDGSSSPGNLVATSCGAGCKHIQVGAAEPLDFHLQGTMWTATSEGGLVTIDNNTLAGSTAGGAFQLTKVG
jgi:hypothetical protein